MTRRSATRIAIVIALLLAASFFGYRLSTEHGQRTGAATGQQTLYRLQLVWPDYLQMSDDERAVLASLSMRCRLHEQAAAAENVVRCLTDAAVEMDSESDDARSGTFRTALRRLLPNGYAGSVTAPH